MPRIPFFAVRHDPPPMRRTVLMLLSFILPLGTWAAVSYLPFLWHPLMEIRIGGGATFAPGDRIPHESWDKLVAVDGAWWTDFQATGGRIERDGQVRFHAVPGKEPIGAGRSLRRSNSKAIYSFGPALLAANLVEEDQLRDADALAKGLGTWQERGFNGSGWALSDVNQQRAVAVLQGLDWQDGELQIPDGTVLPMAAPQGFPANPVFLPAPHEVALALVSAFTTEPQRDGDPWLHERLFHSLWVVVKGFGLALLVGLPLGLSAGAFPALSRLIEPVTNFVGYIPPPAFGALLVAIFGLGDGPKVAMVVIAMVFPMIIVIANTVRNTDVALIEAGQTLGTSRRSLVTNIIIPASMPRIFDDLRVLLALGWTILIIAELTGEKSGLSAYMDQQGKYRHYENVFAAMLIIGTIGLITDQFLAAIHPLLFPWQGRRAAAWVRGGFWLVMALPRMAYADAAARQAGMAARLAEERGPPPEDTA